jgi:hypothetical protein
MKTTEQNTKEVMNYLNRSSQHLFMSEDGKDYQVIVKIKDGFALIKNGDILPIKHENYITEGVTAGKTFVKRTIHPVWNPSPSYRGYGFGPAKKLRSVKYFKAMREEIKKIIAEFESK